MTSNNNNHPFIPFISSGITGIVFAPLELGSTRSKSTHARSKGFRMIFDTAKTEGFLSLWKGSSWFIIGNSLSRTTWLISYDFIKGENPSNNRLLLSGFLAGGITAAVSNPIWSLKSYAQLPNYPGIFFNPNVSLRNIVTSYNHPLTKQNRKSTFKPHVLMSGTLPAMTYVSIESMCQLFLFEKIKLRLDPYIETISTNNTLLCGLSGALAGGISRIIILPIVYPLHVITLRIREQKKLQTNNSIIASIRRDNAWYAGIGPYSVRVASQSCILFFFLEIFRSFYR